MKKPTKKQIKKMSGDELLIKAVTGQTVKLPKKDLSSKPDMAPVIPKLPKK